MLVLAVIVYTWLGTRNEISAGVPRRVPLRRLAARWRTATGSTYRDATQGLFRFSTSSRSRRRGCSARERGRLRHRQVPERGLRRPHGRAGVVPRPPAQPDARSALWPRPDAAGQLDALLGPAGHGEPGACRSRWAALCATVLALREPGSRWWLVALGLTARRRARARAPGGASRPCSCWLPCSTRCASRRGERASAARVPHLALAGAASAAWSRWPARGARHRLEALGRYESLEHVDTGIGDLLSWAGRHALALVVCGGHHPRGRHGRARPCAPQLARRRHWPAARGDRVGRRWCCWGWPAGSVGTEVHWVIERYVDLRRPADDRCAGGGARADGAAQRSRGQWRVAAALLAIPARTDSPRPGAAGRRASWGRSWSASTASGRGGGDLRAPRRRGRALGCRPGAHAHAAAQPARARQRSRRHRRRALPAGRPAARGGAARPSPSARGRAVRARGIAGHRLPATTGGRPPRRPRVGGPRRDGRPWASSPWSRARATSDVHHRALMNAKIDAVCVLGRADRGPGAQLRGGDSRGRRAARRSPALPPPLRAAGGGHGGLASTWTRRTGGVGYAGDFVRTRGKPRGCCR